MMKAKHIISLITIIATFTVIDTQMTSLTFELTKGETHCFQESIPEKAVTEFGVESDRNVTVTLRAQDGKIIHSSKKDVFKHSFTTEKYGYYEICITNSNNKQAEYVNLMVRYGVGMRDYSSLARAKDLKPIDLELKKLSDRSSLWKHYASWSTQMENAFDYNLNSISSNIVWYSVILICVMIVVGLMETFYLKKFMEKRKVI